MTRDPLTGTALPTTAPAATRVHICADDAFYIPRTLRKYTEADMPNNRKLSEHAHAALIVMSRPDAPTRAIDIRDKTPTDSTLQQIKAALAMFQRNGYATSTRPGKGREADWTLTESGRALAESTKRGEDPTIQPAANIRKAKPAKADKPAKKPAHLISPHMIPVPTADAPEEDFLCGITSDGRLLIFEGNGQPAIDAQPYVLARDHARALVRFLRTLPEGHELSL